MKRLLLGAVVVGLVVAAAALSGSRTATPEFQVQVEDRNPWTNLRFNNDPNDFQFAVVSDRTGGHREKVFARAIEQLNLLQPEFVVSVGDLIEGYTKDPVKLAGEWKEFQSYVSKLQMPFFYVPGNHDVSNAVQEKVWREKFGRRYYHFVYRNVLFLALDSDQMPEKEKEGVILPEQVAYVKKVLAENCCVRWTIVLLHRPLWAQTDTSKNGWLDVEALLAGRSYTVFAGHVHRFQKFVRNGQRYYQLATTGGASRMRGERYGEVDHIVWVTMKKDGPLLANVLLDGVYGEDMSRPASEETGSTLTNRRATQPARGTLHFEGSPAADAQITFYRLDGTDKRPLRVADALVEADGSFTLSTYSANDGAPAGEYLVTAVWYRPHADAEGKRGPNLLPERYSKPETSGLKATVKDGMNEFPFDLKK